MWITTENGDGVNLDVSPSLKIAFSRPRNVYEVCSGGVIIKTFEVRKDAEKFIADLVTRLGGDVCAT